MGSPIRGTGRAPTATEPDANVEDAGADAGPPVLGEVLVRLTPDGLETRPLDSASVEIVIDSRTRERTIWSSDDGSFVASSIGSKPYWVRVRQTDGIADLLTTLTRVENVERVDIFERRVLEDVADNLALPVLLDPKMGHALFYFVRDDSPLEGVSLVVNEGSVAYDSGALFTDAFEATQEGGAAILLNVSAVPFPGGTSEFEIVVDGQSERVEIELAQDAVSVVTLEL